MSRVSSMVYLPSGPVVIAGIAAPPCITAAPSSGALPSSTTPLTTNVGVSGMPVDELTAWAALSDVDACADDAAAPPAPTDGESDEHASAPSKEPIVANNHPA